MPKGPFLSSEDGQVLYMTVAAMASLAMFFLVLVNVIYIAAVKVKAQNTADQIAISAATLKARVLNKLTQVNAVFENDVMEGGRIHVTPYADSSDKSYCRGLADVCGLVSESMVAEYNCEVYPALDRLVSAMGIHNQNQRIKIYPLTLTIEDPWGLLPAGQVDIGFRRKTLFYLDSALSELPIPIYHAAYAVETKGTLFVQTRVEWRTRRSLIGGGALGITLPDVTARARAEIVDSRQARDPWRHDWEVQLAQPDAGVDEYIRNWR